MKLNKKTRKPESIAQRRAAGQRGEECECERVGAEIAFCVFGCVGALVLFVGCLFVIVVLMCCMKIYLQETELIVTLCFVFVFCFFLQLPFKTSFGRSAPTLGT